MNRKILHLEVPSSVFTRCTGFGKEWNGDEEFLSDRENVLDGRQVASMRWIVE